MGLLGFIRKDGTREACYNHRGSNPGRLGKAIVDFLLTLKAEDFDIMAERVEQIKWVQHGDVPDDEIKAEYSRNGYHIYNPRYRRRFGINSWYSLLMAFYRHSWTALPHIKDGKLRHLMKTPDYPHFVETHEWAYYIDFNKRTLEIHGNGDVVSFDKLIAEPDWIFNQGGYSNEPREDDQPENTREDDAGIET